MRYTLNVVAVMFAALVISACGDATPDPASPTANASLSAGAIFDAAGIWTTESTTCAGFPVPAQFQNSVQSLAGNVQTFVTDITQADSMIVAPSEGTLDTQSGAYVLCYTATLANCTLSCTGTVDAENRASLSCTNANNGSTCTIVLHK